MKIFLLFISMISVFATSCLADNLRLDIEIEQPELKKVLESALILPSSLNSAGPLNKRWLRHYQKQLPALTSSMLEPYGYFHSQAETRVEQLTEGKFVLTLLVQPGEPIHISSLALQLSGSGATLAELQQELTEFPLKQGDILRQDFYEQGKALLLQRAIELGFLDADFQEHQIKVHRGERRAEIALRLDTGLRYRFGPTTFSGGSGYPEPFLRRYLSYRQGDVYSHRKLGQTQHNLLNADLFRQVDISPTMEAVSGEQMPVAIALQPSPRHRWRPGIGYGTDTGARVSLRYRDLNLLQRGHELKGDLLLAQRKQSLVTAYIIPDLQRLDSQSQLRLGYDREVSDSYSSRELFTEAEYQRAFGSSLLASLFLRLTQEDSKVGQETTRARMLLPGARLQWRKVDNPVAPKSGLQGNIEIKGAEEALFSDTSLLQLTAQTTNLLPLPRKYSLLLRLQGGTTWHNDPLRDLPASLRFFAGGDRSVRGYGYQSLGPRDPAGQVVGGKHLLVANIELEKRFSQNWAGAVFYDLGNAFDSFAEYELEQGAGLGVRRYTPIGPIRLDLARQIGNNRQRWRLHFSMGFGW